MIQVIDNDRGQHISGYFEQVSAFLGHHQLQMAHLCEAAYAIPAVPLPLMACPIYNIQHLTAGLALAVY